MEEILSLEEACKMLHVAKPTLYGYARRGQIPCFKIGRSWKFHKESLDQWMRDKIKNETQERKQISGVL